MSLRPLRPDDLETFTVETHPRRTYSSSSATGPTGSVYLFANRSESEKEVAPSTLFRLRFEDRDLEVARRHAVQESTGSSHSIKGTLTEYLSQVFSQSVSQRKSQRVEVVRFTPPTELNSNTLRKAAVMDVLGPFYRSSYPTSGWDYSNYHSLCFFTASGYSTDAALLYPNPRRPGTPTPTLSEYGTTGSFSFDFWINPRWSTDAPDGQVPWKAGTLFHLTSSYALSLITGSLRDENGFPKGFRLLLQLSESADIKPSIALGTFILSGASSDPQTRFVFSSDDNALLRDRWQHVTVRWGGPTYNNGSGSFVVDEVTRGSWVCTSSMTLGDYLSNVREPSVLVVGNYYEGRNTSTNALTRFFANLTTQREGLLELDSTTDVLTPSAYAFTHPLTAEVHDLKFYDRYLTNADVAALQETGPDLQTQGGGGLRFWVPPFFTQESPVRTAVNNEGGIMVSPFQVRNGSPDFPVNKFLMMTCGGHQVSLPNHLREFVTGRYPRAHALTASVLSTDAQTPTSCNEILYNTGSNQKSLYLVMPCDNGSYQPRFDALSLLSQERFKRDGLWSSGGGVVSLRNVFTGSAVAGLRGLVAPSGSIVDQLVGPTPEVPSDTLPGDSMAVLHRTRDNTSNQVVFFDISNLFYGSQIRPGTVTLEDPVLSGSGGRLGMTIKDDGQGNLYRADSETDHSTWSSVGNIFYNEGIMVLKHPVLYFFGKDKFNLSFEGTQNVHTMKFHLVAGAGLLTTSSNTTYTGYHSASNLAHDTEKRFVYLTSVQVHDDNLNVVMRTTVAQPVVKRYSDRIVFRPKIDF